jgi:hypothetical protein
MKFKCVRACQWEHSIWKINDEINVSEIVKCPVCKGQGCEKCHNTGRKSPPHHFEPVEQEKPVTYVEAPSQPEPSDEQEQPSGTQEEQAEKIDELRKEFELKGVAFDRRWGLKRLKDELKKALKEGR